MAHWLRVYIPLAEDPSSVCSTHIDGSQLPIFPAPGALMPQPLSVGICTHVRISTDIHTYIIESSKNKV